MAVKIKQKKYLVFDPRTQLLVLLLACLTVFIVDLPGIYLLFIFMLAYFISQGLYRRAFKNVVAFGAVWLFQLINVRLGIEILASFGFMTVLFLRFLPVTMAASCLGNLSTGKLMAALQTLRLPLNLIIALAVALRFTPVLKADFQAIQVSAKQRGLALSQPRNWLRPMHLFEVSIVPLLMRSLKISDELAASAATKGIDYPCQKTSVYVIRFSGKDVSLLITYCVWLVVVFIYGSGS